MLFTAIWRRTCGKGAPINAVWRLFELRVQLGSEEPEGGERVEALRHHGEVGVHAVQQAAFLLGQVALQEALSGVETKDSWGWNRK